MERALDSRRAVQSQVAVSPGAISIQLFLVGSADEAGNVERELVARLAAATGVVPTVRVVAVPDADALRQAAGASETTPVGPTLDLDALRRELDSSVRTSWPDELGPLLGWGLQVPDSARGGRGKRRARPRLRRLGGDWVECKAFPLALPSPRQCCCAGGAASPGIVMQLGE